MDGSPAGTSPLRVGLGLGSNVGDRLELLRRARDLIHGLPGVSAAACAPLYETEPVGCPPGSMAFLNTVMEIGLAGHIPILTLLERLREIEHALGRPTRHPHHAPRTVDIDILYAGSLVRDEPSLVLPHPRLTHRRFVLEPLAALRPELVLPGFEKPVHELLRELVDPAKVTLAVLHW